MSRKGLALGTGKGYRNIIGRDPSVHSQSARGVKQPQKINSLTVPLRESSEPLIDYDAYLKKNKEKRTHPDLFEGKEWNSSYSDKQKDEIRKKSSPNFNEIKVGMVFSTGTKTKDGLENFARVTKIPFFKKKGDRQDIFYAIFVDPNDFSQKRLYSDEEFAQWDFQYDKSNWLRVK